METQVVELTAEQLESLLTAAAEIQSLLVQLFYLVAVFAGMTAAAVIVWFLAWGISRNRG